MMYENIIKALRLCVKYNKAMDALMNASQAADAIEELQQTVEHYKGCSDDWYREACDYKAMLPRWIPVTERLPEEGVSVQVCFLSQGGKAQAVSERFVDNRNQSYWSGLCGMKPTHWMPLPEPPKEEA